jgi:hypothetical protein
MNLDELENDPTPRFVRMTSHEPKDGYFWNEYFQYYEEGDALFRIRILGSMTPQPGPSALTSRLREFGVTDAFEWPMGQLHWALIVGDEHVEAARQAVYDAVPVGYRFDVIGKSSVEEWRASWSDTTQPRANHVRDAVNANR